MGLLYRRSTLTMQKQLFSTVISPKIFFPNRPTRVRAFYFLGTTFHFAFHILGPVLPRGPDPLPISFFLNHSPLMKTNELSPQKACN